MTNPEKSSEAPKAEPTFEQALVQLEEIVRVLEQGDLPLEDSLAHYQKGVQNLARCTRFLSEAEHKIQLLTGVNAAGEPQSEPFDEGATTLEEKAAARGRRRTSPKTRAPEPSSGDEKNSDDLAGGTLF